MAIPGTLGLPELAVTPSVPAPGTLLFFTKTDGNAYILNSAGMLSVIGSVSAITSLTGDVTGTGPGATVATVQFVGGQAAATIAASVVEVGAATSANVINTLVKRDASGNFSAGTITATLNGNASTATSAISSISFTGALAGDVTGTQSLTVVAFVGGKTAADVAAATATVDAATSTNIPGTLVIRDGTGNFAAGTITAALTGNVTGNVSGTAANVTGVVAIVNGGTNSSSALANNRIMISASGAIVEASAITAHRALVSNVNGIPVASVTTDTELSYVSGVTSSIQSQLNAITGSGITGLTGDVSATGPGNVAATVNSVGGSSAANIHSAELAANAATSLDTASTIVKRDASGNFAAGFVSLGQLAVTGVANVVQAVVQAWSSQTVDVLDVLNFGGSKLFSVDNSGNGVFLGTIAASNFSGSSSGTNTGDVSLAAFGSSPNANGLSISGQVLNMQPADGTHPGGVSILSQSFAGVKTFLSAPVFNSLTPNYALVLDGSKNVASLQYTPANNNSTLVSRDVAGNSAFNNVITAVTEITSAGQTISMNYASTGHQRVNGTASVIFNLPDATYMTNGEEFRFNNNSTGSLTIYKNDGVTLVDTVLAGGMSIITCIDNSTTNGQWDPHHWLAQGATSGTAGTTLPGTLSAGNFSGSSSGTNTGDVTTSNTNSINLAFASGQTGLNATLNLSAAVADAGNVKATYSIKTDGLFIEIPYGTPVNIGTSNMSGSASSFALSDHVHNIPASVVMGLLLTGYTTGTNTVISASNSILSAFENLQAQISATVGAAITSLTGDVAASGPGAAAATIQPNVVTYAKFQQVAASSLVGNPTGSTANAQGITLGATLAFVGTILETSAQTGDVTTSANSFVTTVAKIQGTTVSGTTGSGNVVFSASPTFSGTISAAAISASSLTDTSLTTGSIVFVGASGLLTQDNTKFYWDDTNFALGVGTIPGSGTVFDIVNNSGSIRAIQSTSYGATAPNRGRYANGTLALPTAATAGNSLHSFSGRGYGATGFAAASTGVMSIVAGETFTDTSMATYMTFSTTPTTSVTAAERMRINSTGRILMNTTTDNGTDQLQVNGSVNSLTMIVSGTAGAGYHQFNNQSAAPATPTGAFRLYADASSRLSWIGTNGYTRTFDGTANTANRTYVLPDTSDQIATAQMTTAFKTAVVALTFGANVATDASLGNVFTLTLTGTANLSAPSNAINGQKITYRITQDATGGRSLTFDTIFNFGTSTYGNTLTANKTDYIGCMYNSSTSKWDVVAFAKGF
jgi:hypothetical protein